MDFSSLYPAAIKPAFLDDIRNWYIATYSDRFFTHPPAWFEAFVWIELLYQAPLNFWAIGALQRSTPPVLSSLTHAPSWRLQISATALEMSVFSSDERHIANPYVCVP